MASLMVCHEACMCKDKHTRCNVMSPLLLGGMKELHELHEKCHSRELVQTYKDKDNKAVESLASFSLKAQNINIEVVYHCHMPSQICDAICLCNIVEVYSRFIRHLWSLHHIGYQEYKHREIL